MKKKLVCFYCLSGIIENKRQSNNTKNNSENQIKLKKHKSIHYPNPFYPKHGHGVSGISRGSDNSWAAHRNNHTHTINRTL